MWGKGGSKMSAVLGFVGLVALLAVGVGLMLYNDRRQSGRTFY
jgi:hypothetical protein